MDRGYSIVFLMGVLYCKGMGNKFYRCRRVKNMNGVFKCRIVLCVLCLFFMGWEKGEVEGKGV